MAQIKQLEEQKKWLELHCEDGLNHGFQLPSKTRILRVGSVSCWWCHFGPESVFQHDFFKKPLRQYKQSFEGKEINVCEGTWSLACAILYNREDILTFTATHHQGLNKILCPYFLKLSHCPSLHTVSGWVEWDAVVLKVLFYLFLLFCSKPLMPQQWFATWGVSSSAPVTKGPPPPCPVRAELTC